ncbi:regulatory protein IE1 [Aotine betaherpesvirus 1]|uniref:Regulatory protein IE1 n=1 Tax=Aotine betaherpesvirus 1 TaxID=50290 RepID=G8XUI0_9BETA|nr:regulatory protein IE1 [Aotine betaherpesvirus 1]AEV80810.1 regulatory protein IE1 [Aotine betaherpesvirus 1]
MSDPKKFPGPASSPKRRHPQEEEDYEDPGEGTSSGTAAGPSTAPSLPKKLRPHEMNPVDAAAQFLRRAIQDEIETQMSLGDPLFSVSGAPSQFMDKFDDLRKFLIMCRKEMVFLANKKYREAGTNIIVQFRDIWGAVEKGIQLINETSQNVDPMKGIPCTVNSIYEGYVVDPQKKRQWLALLSAAADRTAEQSRLLLSTFKEKCDKNIDELIRKCRFSFLKYSEQLMKCLPMPKQTPLQSQAKAFIDNAESQDSEMVLSKIEFFMSGLEKDLKEILGNLDAVADKVTEEGCKNVMTDCKGVLDTTLYRCYALVNQASLYVNVMAMFLVEETVKVVSQNDDFNMDEELDILAKKTNAIAKEALAAAIFGYVHHGSAPNVEHFRQIAEEAVSVRDVPLSSVVIHGAGESDSEEITDQAVEPLAEQPAADIDQPGDHDDQASDHSGSGSEKGSGKSKRTPQPRTHPMVTRSKHS